MCSWGGEEGDRHHRALLLPVVLSLTSLLTPCSRFLLISQGNSSIFIPLTRKGKAHLNSVYGHLTPKECFSSYWDFKTVPTGLSRLLWHLPSRKEFQFTQWPQVLQKQLLMGAKLLITEWLQYPCNQNSKVVLSSQMSEKEFDPVYTHRHIHYYSETM